MIRSKIILLAAFVLVMCAGVVVGRLWNQKKALAAETPSWLVQQLDLRPDQKQQMDAIWSEALPQINKNMERRQSLEHERDQAIQDLLTPSEWLSYARIMEEFSSKQAELDKQSSQVRRDADERSKALLDDAQKRKWEAAVQNFRDWHSPHGTHKPRGGPHGPHGTQATQPTTAAAAGL